MPRYSVILTRDTTESCAIHVVAETEDAAHEAAIRALWNVDDPEWETDDGASEPYVTACDIST